MQKISFEERVEFIRRNWRIHFQGKEPLEIARMLQTEFGLYSARTRPSDIARIIPHLLEKAGISSREATC